MMRVKFIPLEISNVRAAEKPADAKGFRFSGYGSTFGNVDSYGDIIMPGAFADTLAKRDWPVQMFYNHRLGTIGKYAALGEDEKGLKFEGELTPGHSVAADVEAGIRHGSIGGMSIGFSIPKGGAVSRDPENDPEGWRGLVINKIDLWELSVVDMPANVMAEIGQVRDALGAALARELEAAKQIREIEEVLRGSAGLSRRAVEMLTARYKAVLVETEVAARDARIADLAKTVSELQVERELVKAASRFDIKV